MHRSIASVVLAIGILHAPVSSAQQADDAIFDGKSSDYPVISARGMVVAQEGAAAHVGAKILADGGNAVDAAVATGFALAVTLPRAGNLAGGGFMMIHLAETGETLALDYREMAPLAAHRDMYLDEDGNVDSNLARFSHLAAGVPGTVAGLLYAHEKYGTLPLEDLLAPAIRLAEEGYKVSYVLGRELAWATRRLGRNEAASKIYLKPDGAPYEPGDTFKQTDLAWTLRQISQSGLNGFYRGPVAQRIAADMKANGGIMTVEDLQRYKVVVRKPIYTDFRGYTIAAMPPPSSGGVHIVQMLNILRDDDFKALGQGSADAFHLMAEAMKYAYADRSKYLGDPDFFDVPVDDIISLPYAKAIRSKINMDRATPSEDIKPIEKLPYESPDTTHYSVADKYGNVVSNTYTLNFSYGSGLVAAGTGMLLNNEMDDFVAKPGVPNAFGLLGDEANSIEPSKRPLSSMSPVIVLKDGKAVFATGSIGGSRIITSVMQILINRFAFELNIAEATARPRIHHQWYPDTLYIEPHASPDTLKLLEAKGYKIRTGRKLGGAESIELGDGLFYGAADGRRPSPLAVGVP